MANYSFEATWDGGDDWSDFTVDTGSGYMTASRSARHDHPWRAGAGKLVATGGVSTQSPYAEAAPTIPAQTGARFARWTTAIRMQTITLTQSHRGPFQITAKDINGVDLGVVAYTELQVSETGQDASSIWTGDFSAKTLDPPDDGPGVEVSALLNTWQVWDFHCLSYGETAAANTCHVTANIYIERGGRLVRHGLFVFDDASLASVYSWTGFRIGMDSMAAASESFTFWLDEFRIAMSGDVLPKGKLPISRTWLVPTIL